MERVKKLLFNRFVVLAMGALLVSSTLTGCMRLISPIAYVLTYEDDSIDNGGDGGNGDDKDTEEDDSKAKSAEKLSEDRYFYGTLNEEEQKVYDQIYQGLVDLESSIYVSTDDPVVAVNAYVSIFSDHGEIFWIDSTAFDYEIEGDEMLIEPDYNMTKGTKEEMETEVRAKIDEWLADAPRDGSDYEKSKYVYESLCNNVVYDLEVDNSQNVLSIFLERRAVCAGYAKGAQILLRELGIESSVVIGRSHGELHAWNLLRLDGQYYYFDATWADREGEAEDGRILNVIDYSYLNVTYNDISRDHTEGDELASRLPEANSYDLNYYVINGKYFDSYSLSDCGNVISNDASSGAVCTQIRFSNQEAFNSAKYQLVENVVVADYWWGFEAGYDMSNEDMFTIIVYCI